MDEMLKNLECVLNIGYSILMELDKIEPDIEKVELLYEKRASALGNTRTNWDISDLDPKELSESVKLADIKNIFLRLSLLEKKLNGKLETLKVKKTQQLRRLDQVKKATNNYDEYQTGPAMNSLFMDIKPGLN